MGIERGSSCCQRLLSWLVWFLRRRFIIVVVVVVDVFAIDVHPTLDMHYVRLAYDQSYAHSARVLRSYSTEPAVIVVVLSLLLFSLLFVVWMITCRFATEPTQIFSTTSLQHRTILFKTQQLFCDLSILRFRRRYQW